MSEGNTVVLPDGHFGNEVQHEVFKTDEGKQFLSKYTSVEDALVGGFNASKMVGKKLENVIQKPAKDAKPEDVATYQASLLKELGAGDTAEAYKDINWTIGMAEGSKADEALVGRVSKFAAEKKIPKSIVQEFVGLNNQMVAEMRQAQEQAQLAQMKVTNEALLKEWGGEKGVAEATELVKRMFAKNVAPDQFEAVGKELAESGMTRSPLLTNVLMKLAQGYKEDSTNSGTGGSGTTPDSPERQAALKLQKENPKTFQAMGWKVPER